jgi:hypothetical protein
MTTAASSFQAHVMVAFGLIAPCVCLSDPCGRLSNVVALYSDGQLSMGYLVEAKSARSSVVNISFAQPQVD